jgi:NTP pyrophosphatase (non-canonical NTP hydrolase)
MEDMIHAVQEFCEARDWDQYHNPKDLSIGIVSEAAELLEHFRYKSHDEMEAFFDDATKREAIEDEVADILFLVFRFAQKHDIDIEEAFERKLQKNKKKYPVEQAKGRNEKYDEL